MKFKKCGECGGKMEEMKDKDPLGVEYHYWKCSKCGEEILDMDQLHEAADQYRKLKKTYEVTISKWGTALALRIPKVLVEKQGIESGEKALILPEKEGFKVIPEK